MNRNEQLAMWVRGQSVHDTERDECCPDFSCCNPELLAAKEEREHFLASDDNERERMLMMFLGKGMKVLTSKNVFVTGPERPVQAR